MSNMTDSLHPGAEQAVLPLAQLHLHVGNVRQTQVSDAEQGVLMASLMAHGLINPLSVIKAPDIKDNEAYAVFAGGRRLAALNALEGAGALPASLSSGIPCMVYADEAVVGELSLAENEVRARMSASDQIEAWGRLHANGLAPSVIASRFGVSEQLVIQRLRLSSVAPAILAAFRAEELNLDTLKAFTLSEDHATQLAVFTELRQADRLYGYTVRQSLTGEAAMRLDKPLARFVGLAAYEQAGGRSTRDLFAQDGQEVILHDSGLVRELAQSRIGEVLREVEAEGWKWVSYRDDQSALWSLRRLRKEGAEATEDEEARLQELRELYWQTDDRDALEEERDRIEAAIEARGVWTEEQRAIAGVMVTLGSDGQLDIRRGLVRKADDPTLKASRTDRAERVGQTDRAETSKPVLSAKLADDLAVLRTQIIQAHLLAEPELGYDMLLFTLIQDVEGTYDRLCTITHQRDCFADDLSSLPMGNVLTSHLDKLDRSWQEQTTSAARFAAFRALSASAKQGWLTYISAGAYSTALDGDGRSDDARQLVAASLCVDWAAAWRPDAGFWSRLSKSAIAELVTPVLGAEWVKAALSLKKATLAQKLGDVFAGKAKSLTSEQQAAVTSWQVPGLAPFAQPPSEEKPAKPKAKRKANAKPKTSAK